MDILNILTIDVEDYFQVENFKNVISFSDWPRYEIRVERNTDKILNILSSKGVKATFFVLGWIAQKFPQLIKRIHNAGHEIATHSYKHQLIYTQTPEEFKEDLKVSKGVLEDIIQEKVYGFRAPSYSITIKSKWALDILMEEGFEYDSSLFPIHHDKGGLPEAGRYPYKIRENGCYMWEFPISTVRIMGQNLPFSGGGYFRLLPYNIIKGAINRISKENQPTIVYLHPWEFDKEQPRIKTNVLSMFRHYVNISKTEDKLNRLLDDFKFTSVKDFLDILVKQEAIA